VVVSTSITAIRETKEAIKIQLATKRRDLTVLEESFDDLLLEAARIVNNESSAVGEPRDDAVISLFFQDLENDVKLQWKWSTYTILSIPMEHVLFFSCLWLIAFKGVIIV